VCPATTCGSGTGRETESRVARGGDRIASCHTFPLTKRSEAARPCPEGRPFFARRTAGLRRQDSVHRPLDPCPCIALLPPLLHLPRLLPRKGPCHGLACAPLLPCMDITLCVDDSIRLARRVAPSSPTPPVVRSDDDHRPARPPGLSRSTSHTVQADHGCHPARRAYPSSVTAIAVQLDEPHRPARRHPSSTSTAGAVARDRFGRQRGQHPPSSWTMPFVHLTGPSVQLDDTPRPVRRQAPSRWTIPVDALDDGRRHARRCPWSTWTMGVVQPEEATHAMP
jgi:hypothetical protein